MAPKKYAYLSDSPDADINLDDVLLKARHEHMLTQLEYLAAFLEKAGMAVDSHSAAKDYPEAAGVGSGALSGAYAMVRSMAPHIEPSPQPSEAFIKELRGE
jgi:hypothetical protein